MIKFGEKYKVIKHYATAQVGDIFVPSSVSEMWHARIIWFEKVKWGVVERRFDEFFQLAQSIPKGHPITSIFK
jgi:hypothetical protein